MFDELQTTTLRAVVDRIVPADDFPSGWMAGVGEYMFRLLAGDLSTLLDMYRTGLDDLDNEALARHGVHFAALQAPHQDELLQVIEQGQVRAQWRVDPAAFFRMLVEHTIEGYYSSPDTGGNHDRISWRMIGFEVRG